jgi:hypothetical protein
MKHDEKVHFAGFSPDGRWVVTASEDETARVWDALTGKAISAPMKHNGHVNSAEFSPDSRWVVTASWDKTARVWDAASGKAVSEPLIHDDPVHSAEFSPDGRWVAARLFDFTERRWEVLPKTDASLAAAIAYAGEAMAQRRLNELGGMDELTPDEWLLLRDWVEANHPSPEARQFVEWLLAPKATRSPTPFRQSP